MKKIFLCLISFVLILCLSGCHGSKGITGFSVPEEFDETKQYEITFWAKNDTNKNQVDVYKKAISDFETLYPNVHVTLKLYTDYSRIYNDVITNISTNTTPNVCITYPDHIATYMTGSNVVVNLDEIIDNDKYGLGGSEVKFDAPKKEEIVEKFLNECMIDGSYYALPYMRSTEALYINKDLLNKLGYEMPEVLTWDFIFEVSEKAMEKDADGNFKVNGQKVLIPFIYKSTDNMMISMLKQLNAGYSNDEGEIEIFNEDTKRILYEVAKHAGSGSFSTFKISSYPGNYLNAGQCIFAVDSTAGAAWIGSHAPLTDIAEDQIVEFETVVKMIPQYDTENPKMISQGPSICIFNKADNQEVLASWLFAQYLLTNDIQIGYSSTEGYIPVTSKAQQSKDYQDYLSKSGIDEDHYSVKIDASNLLLENIDNTFVTSVFNGSASLRDAAGNLIEAVCKATKKNTVFNDEYMENLFDTSVSLYHLDQVGKTTADTDLGALPTASKILIGALISIWVMIGAYVIYQKKNK